MFILKTILVGVFVVPILAGCMLFLMCAMRIQAREERGVTGEQ